MGKGDRKTRRGKIWSGSHGKTRPKKKKTTIAPVKKEEKAD
ncbi:MAG: 30S ribosomal protein THX [Bacteroidetes bacterium]|nr:30S ribosomal protein THX [Bacteroidota bacterium]